MKSNIFEQLKHEHEELKKILSKGEDCPSSERSKVLKEIEKNLIPHSRGEEKTIYSIARARAQATEEKDFLDLTNEAYEEHHVADGILKELKSIDVKSERWIGLYKVLKENIEHHIKEEEKEFFGEARKLFDVNEAQVLCEYYLEAKDSFAKNLPNQSQISERSPTAQVRKDFMQKDQTV